MGLFPFLNHPLGKPALVLLGTIALSIFAFHGTIVFWPQDNPFETTQVEISKGASLAVIGSKLKEQKILTNERTFLMAVKILGHETNIPAGKFTLLDPKNNYQIIRQLVEGKPVLKKVTLLEGWTMDKISEALEAKLGLNKKGVLALCKNRSFVSKTGIPSKSLEGFLFPDTYFFQEDDSPEDVLIQILKEYQKNISDDLRKRADEMGFSELEMITLASIIEGEAIYDTERSIISAVYHNRLKLGMKLQADPTIQYIIKDSPRRLLNRDLKINSPYNTYLYDGLPPGPVNNPGKASILAALYPDENDYLFFVARGDGYHTFSKTREEHNRAKKAFQKVRRKYRKKRG
jgi:UPF0755 protein